MKLYVAVLLITIGLASADFYGNAGQPGCKTDEEMRVVYYRNIWDSNAYWKCVEQGQPGMRQRCRDNTGWLDSQKACVSWDDWVWEELVEPPSQP